MNLTNKRKKKIVIMKGIFLLLTFILNKCTLNFAGAAIYFKIKHFLNVFTLVLAEQ